MSFSIRPMAYKLPAALYVRLILALLLLLPAALRLFDSYFRLFDSH